MKFNLGEKVKIKSNGVIGIIIARGYNEYLNENDKQQSFEEYQIEADKYYQCNEDEIELCNPVIEEGKYLTKDIIDCKMFEELTGLLKPQEIKNIKVEDKENNNDPVNHPSHYCDGNIEVIDFIIDKKLNFNRGNVIKYTSRAGKKDSNKEVEDLEKARFYLNKEIEILKGDK